MLSSRLYQLIKFKSLLCSTTVSSGCLKQLVLDQNTGWYPLALIGIRQTLRHWKESKMCGQFSSVYKTAHCLPERGASCAAQRMSYKERTRESIFWLFEVLWRLSSEKCSLKTFTERPFRKMFEKVKRVSNKKLSMRLKVLKLKPIPNLPFNEPRCLRQKACFWIGHQANWFKGIQSNSEWFESVRISRATLASFRTKDSNR